ncbi:MAG: hypothetical protein ACLRNZ_11220 [Blautia massiliensis (ex Durand et al. 2017)]
MSEDKKLGLGSVVSISVGLVIATSCLVSLGQGAGTVGVVFIFFHDYCVSFEYDYGGFAFGVECHYAEYDGWPGAVYAGMSGAFSHADLHGGRLSAL